jgi:hypothetical protein
VKSDKKNIKLKNVFFGIFTISVQNFSSIRTLLLRFLRFAKK